MKNFTTLFAKYANEKGFAPNSTGNFWVSSLEKFKVYSEWYQSVMPYDFFKLNVIGE